MQAKGDEKNKFMGEFHASLRQNTFVKLTLGKYRGSDEELENVYITRVRIKGGERLSFRFKYKTKDIFKNYTSDEAEDTAATLMGKDFLYGALFTTSADYIIEYSRKRVPRLLKRKPSFTEAGIGEHNRPKSRFIDTKSKYLNLLGITNSRGDVRGEKYDKFRQVDKFIEIVDSLYNDSPTRKKTRLRIIDYGSGKSYLTFAMYDYFSGKADAEIDMTGVESRKELAEESGLYAKECGFKGLKFVHGTISDFPAGDADIVVALHACDTATDDAIEKAVVSNASIIILAPCCHKYLRRKIQVPEPLKSIFCHGILEERLAVSLTDGLRSLALESKGYTVKVFEFISPEHTQKNTMITAVKEGNTPKQNAEEIQRIKDEFGLPDFYLDRIMKLS